MIKKCDLCGKTANVIKKHGTFVCDVCKERYNPYEGNVCGKMKLKLQPKYKNKTKE